MGRGAPRASMGAGNGGSKEEAKGALQRERMASAKASWLRSHGDPKRVTACLEMGARGAWCETRGTWGLGQAVQGLWRFGLHP